jgi:hypothetical protein
MLIGQFPRLLRAGALPLLVFPAAMAFGAAAARDPLQELRFAPTPGWTQLPAEAANDLAFVAAPDPKEFEGPSATVHISAEIRRNADAALRRLRQFSASRREPVRDIVVDGWPGLLREYRAPYPERQAAEAQGGAHDALFVSFMVAIDSTIVRAEGSVPADHPRAAARMAEMQHLLASMKARRSGDANRARESLGRVRKGLPDPKAGGSTTSGLPSGAYTTYLPSRGLPSGAYTTYQPSIRPVPIPVPSTTKGGELQIAVQGANVAIATQQGFAVFTSQGGAYVATGATPFVATPMAFPRTFGDPTIALGQSGAFYNGTIVDTYTTPPAAGAGPLPAASCMLSVSRSPAPAPGFAAFATPSFPQICAGTGSGTCFPDQPQLAADRWNASPGPVPGDQLYLVWRHFAVDSSANCEKADKSSSVLRIACSTNGGTTWGTPRRFGDSGDNPRIAVARDGTVYVISRDGDDLMVDRFSSCANGLTPATDFPVSAAHVAALECPIAGIDRCESAQLGSYSIATDDAKASRIVVAYSTPSAVAGTETIDLAVSQTSGASWSGSVRVSSNAPGRRILPAVCVTQANAFVGWYDRRAATDAQNDLTDYYLGSVLLDGGLAALGVSDAPVSEVNLTAVPDPQCSIWPSATVSKEDATTCKAPGQLAGRCMVAGVLTATPCSFDSAAGACASGTCTTDRGEPKYGDYNGIACDPGGDVIAAWASATAPGSVAQPAGTPKIRIYASRVRPPTMALKWTAKPVSNLPRFATVDVDALPTGVAAVQDGHATGPIVVGTGSHQVTVSGIWGTANMHTVYSDACDATGHFDIANGDHLTCSADTTINAKGLCEGTCNEQHGRCLARPGPIPSLSDPDARQRHLKQCQDNFAACLARCKTQ